MALDDAGLPGFQHLPLEVGIANYDKEIKAHTFHAARFKLQFEDSQGCMALEV